MPEFKPEIVVNSALNADSTFNVSLSMTESNLEKVSNDAIVDANVQIFKDGELFKQLIIPASGEEGSDAPIFRSLEERPEVGETYELKIEVDGYPMISSTCVIPEPVRLSDVLIDDIKIKALKPHAKPGLTVQGRVLIDNEKEGDFYYHLTEAELFFDWFHVINGDTIITDEDKESVRLPIELVGVGNKFFTTPILEKGYLIEDQGGSFIHAPFEIKTKIDPSFQKLSHVVIKVRHTTRDYFKFHQTYTQQATTSNSFNAPAIPIHSNVNNGQGHFSGFSTSTYSQKFY